MNIVDLLSVVAERGAEVALGPGGTLVLRRAARVPESVRRALRARRDEVLACLQAASKTPPPLRCEAAEGCPGAVEFYVDAPGTTWGHLLACARHARPRSGPPTPEKCGGCGGTAWVGPPGLRGCETCFPEEAA